MTASVERNLETRQHALFVGRRAELASLKAILDDPLSLRVIHIHGPAGIGKTTLARELVRMAGRRGRITCFVDGAATEPTPDAFEAAIAKALGADLAACEAGRAGLLVIDNLQSLEPLDRWMRETFIPRLPASLRVCRLSRNAPSASWRSDPGWRSLLLPIALRNLSPTDAHKLLSRLGVARSQHAPALAFTRGNPLALALVADVVLERPDVPFQPEDSPDLIRMLLERLVGPLEPERRRALEACAVASRLTEPLLAHMLDVADAFPLFSWLSELSFVERGRFGLAPHDLVRDTIVGELRWRNPDWFKQLAERAWRYYRAHGGQGDVSEQLRGMLEGAFLARTNPVLRKFVDWNQDDSLRVEAATQSDFPSLVALVRRHEGEASAAIAERWLARQPGGAMLARDSGEQPAGFLLMVSLDRATAEDIDADPATRAVWCYLAGRAPLRPGETATYHRFLLARDSYREYTQVHFVLGTVTVHHHLTQPNLALSFFQTAFPQDYAAAFDFAGAARIPPADFAVGKREYATVVYDWRATPPAIWAERFSAFAAPEAARPAVESEELVVLSREDFGRLVKEALRSLHAPHELLRNPLVRSRLILGAAQRDATRAQRAAALAAMIREAAQRLTETSNGSKYHRAVEHTYLRPAPSQEQAAELLGLPFSTFRRHLNSGLAAIVEHLWSVEIGDG